VQNLREQLTRMAPHERAFIVAEDEWLRRARTKQILPMGGWSLAIALSGRGFR
jgi:phage terminase large subunit-like protein